MQNFGVPRENGKPTCDWTLLTPSVIAILVCLFTNDNDNLLLRTIFLGEHIFGDNVNPTRVGAAQDTGTSQEAAETTSHEGIFLSNILHQIMPIIQENRAASTGGANSSEQEFAASSFPFYDACMAKLLNSGQAEKEFRVEVEAIGHVRHKNLLRLLGYCIEGAHRSASVLAYIGSYGLVTDGFTVLRLYFGVVYRMLVYEYINNGNLEKWIHGAMRQHVPLHGKPIIRPFCSNNNSRLYLMTRREIPHSA
ncbi:putative serine/threonine-protein kinase [Forsythia ovata]|uniref:non-specific serine/threonine protein kinase n=1 Tax=Forsythia ovata TaxID=205694 RepID=A0ABD1VJJ3_9LAMI